MSVATAPTEVCPPEVRFGESIEAGTVNMIVIGTDTHKVSHTAGAVGAA
jgi:hypothetical protein